MGAISRRRRVHSLPLSGELRLSYRAQELALKRDIPGTDTPTCPAIELDVQPTEEEVDQAAQLGSEAEDEN